jgi:HPt (histidine-containing phosphotransfer) domain-containing protein
MDERLSRMVAEHKYADAAQIVHKIKSSSGSIGAKALYDLSIYLQKALEEGEEKEIRRLKKEFSDTLKKLLEEIALYLG